MSARFFLAAVLVVANAAPGAAQDASDMPYFRFNLGTVDKTVGLPEANVNNDQPTGISVAVPCTQCRGRVNAAFTFLPASFGTQDYAAWQVVSGTPPGGTVDHSTGLVQGVPTTVGTSTFRLGVNDSRNQVVPSPLITLNVMPAPTVSYDSSLGPYARPYAGSPQTTGVLGPASYQVTGGALPDGLSLNRTTGQISGNVNSSAAGIVVTLSDVDGAKAASAPFSIITDQPSILYSGGDYAGRVGVFMSVAPQVLNFGSGFKATSTGTLPPGMSLDPATGTISGAPTQVGTYEGIVVTGSDGRGTPVSSRSLRFVVSKPSVAYASTTTWVGQDYRQSPTVSFLRGPSFYRSTGTLPDGLQLIESTGLISGRPSVAGTFPGLSVLASDPEGALATSSPFQIKVLPALVASIPTPTKGRVNVPLNIQATSANFEAAPTWTFTGTLPNSVTVNKASGLVSGAPTSAGLFSGVTLTASQGGGSVTTNPFTIDVAPAFTLSYDTPVTVPRTRTASLPATVAGALSAPTFARYAGTLPSGLTVNPSTGSIEGKPTVLGTQPNIIVSATDVGGTTYSGFLSITVVDPTATMASLQARVGQAVSQAATSTYLTSPNWTSTGSALPNGLSVTTGGILQGVPQVVGTSTGLRLTATGSDGSAVTPAFQVQVQPDLTIPSVVDPRGGTVGASLTIPAPTVNGLLGTPSYTLISGGTDVSDTLGQTCPGLSFSRSTAVISGRPTATCAPSLAYTVTDSILPKTAQSPAFALNVTPAASTASVPPASTQEGGTVSFSVTTSIDSPTWTVTGQPDWMTFTASGKTYTTSSVSGDETQQKTYRVTVTAAGGGTSSVSSTDVTIVPATVTLANAATRSGGSFSADVTESMTAAGTWSSSAAPADVTLNAVANGKLTGTAPANNTGSAVTRSLRATFTGPAVSAGTRAQAFADATLTVQPPFGLGAVASFTGQAGSPVDLAPPSPSGVIGNVTYQLWQGATNVGATLASTCPGLTFNGGTGRITGTATGACSPTLFYKATDDGNNVANLSGSAQSGTFVFTVTPATVSPSTAALTVNEGETVLFSATTSLQNPTWSLAGTVPSWMSVSNSGGTAVVNSVSGDVTAATTYKVRLVASSAGATATSGDVSVTVNAIAGSLAATATRGKQAFSAAYSSAMPGGTYSVSASNPDVTALAFSNGTLTGVAPDVSATTTRTITVTQAGPAVTGGGSPAQVVGSATLTTYPTLRIASPANATESWQSDVGINIVTPKVTGNAGTLSYSLLVNGSDASDNFGDYCRGLSFNRAFGQISGSVDGAVTPSCDVTFSFQGNDPGASPVPAATVTSAPVRLVVTKQLKVRVPRVTRLRGGTFFTLTGVDDRTFAGTWRVDTTPQSPDSITQLRFTDQQNNQATFQARAPYATGSAAYSTYRATFYHYATGISSDGWGEIWTYQLLGVTSPGDRNGRVGQPMSGTVGQVGLYGTPTYSLYAYDLASRTTGTSDVSGNLPAVCPGVSFNRSTGQFSGTPQAPCNFGLVRAVLNDSGGDAPLLAGQAVQAGYFGISVSN